MIVEYQSPSTKSARPIQDWLWPLIAIIMFVAFGMMLGMSN